MNTPIGTFHVSRPAVYGEQNLKVVLHSDYLAAMAAASAYDEEKERALFEGEFPYVSHSGSYDSWVSRWKYTHEAVDSLWFGWLACAKARAKAAGCL